MSIVSNTTIDVITRGLIKYRLCSHATADTVGAELIRLNHVADAASADAPTAADSYPYERRPFERKVKRIALDGAIVAWQEQIIGLRDTENMPVVHLINRLYDKNRARLEQTESEDYVSFPADVEDTDEGREAVMIRPREVREEENRIRLAERMAALAAERAANPASSNDEDVEDEDEWDDEYDEDDDDDVATTAAPVADEPESASEVD